MIGIAARWTVLLFQRPERGAALFAFLLGALTLPLGSAGTVWLFAGTVYALIMVLWGKLAVLVPRTVVPACVACLIYFASSLVSPLFFPHSLAGWLDVGTCLQFLAFSILVAAMAQTAQVDVLGLYLWGVRIGAIAGFLVALFQVVVLDHLRAKGGMANPIPFSNIALLAGAMSLIGLERLRSGEKVVALIAGLCGLAAALLSQTRGTLVALPLAVIVLLIAHRHLILARWRESTAFLSLLLAGFVLLFMLVKLPQRFEVLAQGLESQTALMTGDPSTSHRAILWTYGMKAMAERPLGYGSQNAVNEVRRIAAREGYDVPPYNHLHNEFITAGVGRGVVGLLALLLVLLAPIALAWRSARDHRFKDRLVFALLLSGGYVAFGLTNVLFSHDQLNSFFVGSFVILTVANYQAAETERFAPAWPLLLASRAPQQSDLRQTPKHRD